MAGKVLTQFHMCLILEGMDLEDAMAIANGNSLSIVLKADEEIICDDSAVVVVGRDITRIRSKDCLQVPVGLISNDN